MAQLKLIKGERLDLPDRDPVNCNGCKHKVGRVCSHYNAFIQHTGHFPTDCNAYEDKA